jgi:general secretion pathway protein E
VVARLKVMAQLDIAERRLPQDGRVAIRLADTNTDLRIAVLPATSGETVVIRIAYIEGGGVSGLDLLGLDDRTASSLRRALASAGGAIIVAGPTGSGKTTTLYAALKELNDGSRSIVTIEDPVERVVEGSVQVEVNTRAGLTFARGLRTILRADPDVILVGEIRDAETAEIAMQAAMTGHLVLTTLHAEGAFAALVRLRELGVPAAAIASSVRLVLSQRLLRRVCAVCSSAESARKQRGCQACSFTGYRGRIAAYESLAMDEALRVAVAADSNELVSSTASKPSVSLRQHALDLVTAGITSNDEVIRVCGEPDERV